MTGSLPALVAAAVFFVVSHFTLSHPALRDAIVGGIGEKPFRALHGVVDLTALAWLILAYASAPYVELWPPVMAARYVPLAVMPVAAVLLVCGLTTKNPTAMYWDKPDAGDPVPGILKITRHPVMWAVILWALAHMAPNGDMGSIIFFAAFATMAVVGMGAIDRRRQRLMGDAWAAIAATTSNLPFAALLGGRTKLDFKEIGIWRIAGGLALYGALLLAHGRVIGLAAAHPRLRVVAAAAPVAPMAGTEHRAVTNLLLPPLTFAEYLEFSGRERAFGLDPAGRDPLPDQMIGQLNEAFIAYLNHGGFPQCAVADASLDSGEIVSTALLNDLPGLHGIGDSVELNRLFTALALNSGGEASIEELARFSGLAKNTLKRYLAYLEAAFLIRRVHRVDGDARRFERAVTFKVYVTNPSLRAALVGPVGADDPVMGRMAETGVVSQWLHADWAAERSAYARWPGGAVDFVELDLASGQPQMAVDVMWDEHGLGEPEALAAFVAFARVNQVPVNYVLTRGRSGRTDMAGTTVEIEPVSRFCYRIGRQIANFSITTGS